eukprot:2007738-Amphidinium_carterae.1
MAPEIEHRSPASSQARLTLGMRGGFFSVQWHIDNDECEHQVWGDDVAVMHIASSPQKTIWEEVVDDFIWRYHSHSVIASLWVQGYSWNHASLRAAASEHIAGSADHHS